MGVDPEEAGEDNIKRELVEPAADEGVRDGRRGVEQGVQFLGYTSMLIKRAEDLTLSESRGICAVCEKVVGSYVGQVHASHVKQVLTYISNEQFQRLPIQNDHKLSAHYLHLSELGQVRHYPLTFEARQPGDLYLLPVRARIRWRA